MPVKRRIIASALLISITSLGSTGLHVASAATTDVTDPYCAVLVDEAPTGGISPILAEVCSSNSPEEASAGIEAAYSSRKGTDASGAEALPVRLMLWYENIDYNRQRDGRMTQIYGDDGPCDTAGYRVEPSSWWKDNMSSIVGDNGCRHVRVHNQALNSAADFSVCVNYNGYWLGAYSDNVGLTQPHAGTCGFPD